jgi:hypothetical protein
MYQPIGPVNDWWPPHFWTAPQYTFSWPQPQGKHAELCPVCKGSGRIVTVSESANKNPSEQCHGCEGKGWVEVG